MTPNEGVADLGRIVQLLTDDWNRESRGLARRGESGRRAIVRCAFAYVEATLFGFKRLLQDIAPLTGVSLGPADSCLIREEQFGVGRDDLPQVRPLFLRPKENVRYTFALASRVLARSVPVDYGGTGWAAFQAALVVRNRITHPKSARDCSVSEDDLSAVYEANRWYRHAFDQALGILRDVVAPLLGVSTESMGGAAEQGDEADKAR